MAQRKGISKTVRFEVFKRDLFTCQYCGSKAPDVILEVDHIKPVSKGGSNEIINLLTSCFDCNRGKSCKEISDNSIVERQRKQIEELSTRREQLEMMLKWREGLNDLKNISSKKAIDYFNKKWNGYTLNEYGENKISKFISEFGISEVLEAIDISYDKYRSEIEDEAFELVLSKLGGVLNLKNKPEIDKKIAYVKGICKNRFNRFNVNYATILLNKYVEALKNKNYTDEDIINDIDNSLIPHAKSAYNKFIWEDNIEHWIEDINNW